MSVTDRQIGYIRGREYWPAVSNSMWNQAAEAAGTGSAQNLAHNLGATPAIVVAMQTQQDTTASDIAFGTHTATNSVITQPDSAQLAATVAGVTGTEISTFGAPGVEVGTLGDVFTFARRVPNNFDPDWPLGFKVHYTSGGTMVATDSFSWIILADIKNEDVAIAAASTVLDTVVPLLDLYGSTTAYLNKWTARGIMDKDWATRAQVEAGAMIVVSVELDAVVGITLGATNPTFFLGLEIDYAPRQTQGPAGTDVDPPLVVY